MRNAFDFILWIFEIKLNPHQSHRVNPNDAVCLPKMNSLGWGGGGVHSSSDASHPFGINFYGKVGGRSVKPNAELTSPFATCK